MYLLSHWKQTFHPHHSRGNFQPIDLLNTTNFSFLRLLYSKLLTEVIQPTLAGT